MTIYKTFAAQPTELGPRTIRVICSDATVDLAGEVVEPGGIDISAFLSNPVVLWSHAPEHPIGVAKNVNLSAGKLVADIEFMPEGMSRKADEVCAMTKAGYIKGISIGFDPIDMAPMSPTKPRGPQRYTACSLMEISVVAIPANPSAEVIQRAAQGRKAAGAGAWKCGAATGLPVDRDMDWDGVEAANSIFDEAGFNDARPDPAMARRGFLAYDASAPTTRRAYKLPFCMVKNGQLTAMASGLRAAADRLEATDIPDDVRAAARRIIEGYGVIASVLEGRALFPTAGSAQNANSPPPPGSGSAQNSAHMERMRCAKALARPPVEADPVPKSREERLAIARATATEPLEKLRLKALDPNENYITRLNAQRDYQTLKASQARHGG